MLCPPCQLILYERLQPTYKDLKLAQVDRRLQVTKPLSLACRQPGMDGWQTGHDDRRGQRDLAERLQGCGQNMMRVGCALTLLLTVPILFVGCLVALL